MEGCSVVAALERGVLFRCWIWGMKCGHGDKPVTSLVRFLSPHGEASKRILLTILMPNQKESGSALSWWSSRIDLPAA